MAGGLKEPNKLDTLRDRAEARAAATADESAVSAPLLDAQRLLHDLQVHQIELEMQNDELQRTQRDLELSRARYFGLYDLAPVGYVTLSKEAVIIEANLCASRIFGATRKALIGAQLSHFVFEDDQDTYYLNKRAVAQQGAAPAWELRIKQPQGGIRWVRMDAATDLGPPNIGVTRLILSDITEERVLHARLAQADRMASLGLLAAGVAHEINNPLTYVVYNSESLAKEVPILLATLSRFDEALQPHLGAEGVARLAGEGKGFLDSAEQADMIERATKVVDGTLRIKTISKGLGVFSKVHTETSTLVDLNTAIHNAVNLVGNEIRHRATLHQELSEVPCILGTDGKLVQVFVNLIVNAVHAIESTPTEHGQLFLRTWGDGDQVFAEVRDTGSGISPENLKLIFGPFYTTKGPERGTGLGLPIVERLVKEMGGRLKVLSEVNVGTRVLLAFPVGKSVEAPIPLFVAEVAAAATATRGRILVVDDEPTIRTVLVRLLSSHHEVIAVGSGTEAKELLTRDSNFDVILCDLMMPLVSGVDLNKWWVERHPDQPDRIVFVTGGVFDPKIADYLQTVTNLQLTKPFDSEELESIVASRVAAARSANAAAGA